MIQYSQFSRLVLESVPHALRLRLGTCRKEALVGAIGRNDTTGPHGLIIWSDNASSEEVNVRGLLLITVASMLWLPASVAQQKAARSARSAEAHYAVQRQFIYPKEFKPGKP